VSDRLKELTQAYVAVEGLLRSQLLSDLTRQQLERFLVELDRDIVEFIRNKLSADSVA
jgi:hypothetical protein